MNDLPEGTASVTAPAETARMWPPRLWNWGSGLLVLAIFLIGFTLVSIGQAVILIEANGGFAAFMQASQEGLMPELTNYPFSLTLLAVLGFAAAALSAIALGGMLIRRHSLYDLGFRAVPVRWLVIAAAGGVIAAGARIGLASGLLALFPSLGAGLEELAALLANRDSLLTSVVTVLLGVLVVPVYEELLFRGVIQNWARNRLGPWLAGLLSALVFGAFHLVPLQAITAMLLGLMLAWAYEKGGSIWPAIVLHAVDNLVAFGLAFLFPAP